MAWFAASAIAPWPSPWTSPRGPIYTRVGIPQDGAPVDIATAAITGRFGCACRLPSAAVTGRDLTFGSRRPSHPMVTATQNQSTAAVEGVRRFA
jgi:hypothetical protein